MKSYPKSNEDYLQGTHQKKLNYYQNIYGVKSQKENRIQSNNVKDKTKHNPSKINQYELILNTEQKQLMNNEINQLEKAPNMSHALNLRLPQKKKHHHNFYSIYQNNVQNYGRLKPSHPYLDRNPHICERKNNHRLTTPQNDNGLHQITTSHEQDKNIQSQINIIKGNQNHNNNNRSKSNNQKDLSLDQRKKQVLQNSSKKNKKSGYLIQANITTPSNQSFSNINSKYQQQLKISHNSTFSNLNINNQSKKDSNVLNILNQSCNSQKLNNSQQQLNTSNQNSSFSQGKQKELSSYLADCNKYAELKFTFQNKGRSTSTGASYKMNLMSHFHNVQKQIRKSSQNQKLKPLLGVQEEEDEDYDNISITNKNNNMKESKKENFQEYASKMKKFNKFMEMNKHEMTLQNHFMSQKYVKNGIQLSKIQEEVEKNKKSEEAQSSFNSLFTRPLEYYKKQQNSSIDEELDRLNVLASKNNTARNDLLQIQESIIHMNLQVLIYLEELFIQHGIHEQSLSKNQNGYQLI